MSEKKKQKTETTNTSKPSVSQLIEEDDEFEEFEEEDWGTDRLQKNDKQTQDTMWQDNWDDEEIDDDFCKQLRAQLQNK